MSVGHIAFPEQAHARRSEPETLGAARENVSRIQRRRMLEAMVREAAERGIRNVTVAHVVARSGVSRRTFYEAFSDRDDCFLAAFEETARNARQRIQRAYEEKEGSSWSARVRAALTGFLGFLDSEPAAGRVLIVESLAAGAIAAQRRRHLTTELVNAFDSLRGQAEQSAGAQPSSLTTEGVIGGVLAVLYARLLESRCPPMVTLTGPLMSMIVLPYRGAAAARREGELPAPVVGETKKTATRDPWQKLDMRLTYRTVRVLGAVAASPGSSNRVIGESAGMSDQGQISKLLRRLQRLGLIENVLASRQRGEPNSWTLTDRGWQVHGAIYAQAASE